METGKCPMQMAQMSEKTVDRGKGPAIRNNSPDPSDESSGSTKDRPRREGKQLKKSQILERGSMEEEIYKFVVSKIVAEVETPFNLCPPESQNESSAQEGDKELKQRELQLDLKLCPPASQNESPRQEGDEELKEIEILDLNVVKKVWSHMVKRVTHRMLSTLDATDEEYDSAEKLNSRLDILLEHESEEELKARKILTSSMWELFANFRTRMQMILRDFEMNHPAEDHLKLHL